jgi:Amt family ammonium transporter
VTGAIVIGLVGGALGAYGVSRLKQKFGVDDSLDAFWVHGFVGIWGSIATALFVAPYLRPDDYAIGTQLVSRMETVILTIAYSAIVTAIVFYISALLTGGGRVDDETEQMCLDEAVHGEEVINL